jgi:hypothetical protein
MIDTVLIRRYICTDYLFSISATKEPEKIYNAIRLAHSAIVELEVHPGRQEEYEYLLSNDFHDLTEHIGKGTYADI